MKKSKSVLPEDFLYYAFVSYSRKDIKEAKWVQDKLESYRLPSKIRKENKDVPRNIFPVFRDQTDLSGTELEESLKAELRASKYLIVICSPNSASSEWVNREIEYFKELGREKFIIPFIIDGTPFSEENECFPEAIKSIDPVLLGVNMKEAGKKHSVLQLIATLLTIRLDTLVERDKKRRIRRNAFVAVLSCICVIIGGFALYYNIPQSRYYADVAYKYEIPYGIYPLSKNERKTRAFCYKVTERWGRVISVQSVNTLDMPASAIINTEDFPVQEFRYDWSGNLVSVSCFNEYKDMILTKKISEINSDGEIAIDYVYSSDATKPLSLAADVSEDLYNRSDERNEITRILNSYNSDGLLEKTLYKKDNLGTAACDTDGVYGKKYEYNEYGQELSVSNLNKQGEVFDCRYGWSEVVYTYNESGLPLSEGYKDKDNNRIWCEGAALLKIVYDENNNLISALAYDESEKLCNCQYGYAEITFEYDKSFLPVTTKRFSSEGKAVCDNFGVHEYRWKYGKKAESSETAFFDTEGNPTYSKDYNCFRVVNILDKERRVVRQEYYDGEGKPMYSSDTGAAAMSFRYDSSGFLNETNYLDENHNLTMSKKGYAVFITERNSLGQIIRTESRDTDGRLICDNDNYAVSELTYNVFGNVETISYFNENEKLCYHIDGFAYEIYEYENGNLTSFSFFDHEGKPVNSVDGYQKCVMEYENGNCVSRRYYAADGNFMVTRNDLYCFYSYEYDDLGNISGMKMSQDGVGSSEVIVRRESDRFGNVTLEYRYEKDLDRSNAFAYMYDDYGNVIVEAYYENGKLVYKEFVERDFTGNITMSLQLDDGDLPYKADDSSYCNMFECSYDELGNTTEYKEYHIGADSKVLLVWSKMDYDASGNCTLVKYFNQNGNLHLQQDMCAAKKMTYNHKGEVVLFEYLDTDLKPSAYTKYATKKTEYNAVGKETKEVYMNSKGELVSPDAGIPATVIYEYDYQGRLVCKSYYDCNDNLCLNNDDYAKIEYSYSESGEITVIKYDENGKEINIHKNIIYVSEIIEGSVAEKMGIVKNSVILSWGDWDYFDELEKAGDVASSFARELAAKESSEKRAVIAAPCENGKIDVYELNLPEGKAGLKISDSYLTVKKIDEIRRAYDEFTKAKE